MTMSTNPTEVRDDLTGTYELDLGHTRFGFAARHALVARVHGWFDSVEGQLQLDGDNRTRSSAALTIDAKSIRTNNPDRDAHLRSGDFFDVDRYPTITFRSSSATDLGHDSYRIVGDLTIKGIARSIEFDLTYQGSCVDPYGQARVGFTGLGSLNRSDWGLSWNMPLNAGGLLLSDRIDLELDVSAIKVI